MNQGMHHEIIATDKIFEGRVISVFRDEVKLPDGRVTCWDRVGHPGAVGIVPLLPDGNVLMVRQFRNAAGGFLLEIPAGKLDQPEEPLECARRELAEETGHSAAKMVKLAEFYNSPGFCNEYFHLYLGTDLVPAEGSTEEEEFLEVVEIPLDELTGMISSRAISDAKSIIGISLTRLYLQGALAAMEEPGCSPAGSPGKQCRREG